MTRLVHNYSVLIATLLLVLPGAGRAENEKQPDVPPVSFYKQIRPILRIRCQGCHQPARAGGKYDMTSFSKLLAGGETGVVAIMPNKPEESYLIEQITPVEGQAEMPRRAPALHEAEIDLIRRWVAEGARDDTPEGAVQRYDAEHPPTYSRPHAITSLDYSPDGELLAVSGFHEVLLHKADGSGLVSRLIGLSERIESVRPDRARLPRRQPGRAPRRIARAPGRGPVETAGRRAAGPERQRRRHRHRDRGIRQALGPVGG